MGRKSVSKGVRRGRVYIMKNFVEKTRFSRSAWIRIAILAVLALAFLLLPVYLKNEYVMRIATLCVMYSALALTLNLITGVMGQVSLGHAAFMGIGAYTSAILSANFEWNFVITALCALLVSALFGMLLGHSRTEAFRQLSCDRHARLLRSGSPGGKGLTAFRLRAGRWA